MSEVPSDGAPSYVRDGSDVGIRFEPFESSGRDRWSTGEVPQGTVGFQGLGSLSIAVDVCPASFPLFRGQ